jgi:hypothetical protein
VLTQKEVVQEKPAQTTQVNNSKAKATFDKSKGTSSANEGADPSSSVPVPDVMAGEAPSPDAAASLAQAKSLQDKSKAGALATAKSLTAKERALLAQRQPLDSKTETGKAAIDKKTLAKPDSNVKPKGEDFDPAAGGGQGVNIDLSFCRKSLHGRLSPVRVDTIWCSASRLRLPPPILERRSAPLSAMLATA